MVRNPGRAMRSLVTIGLAAVLVIQATIIASIVASERASRRADEARITPIQQPNAAWQKNWTQSIRLPLIQAAGSAKLSPDETVLGVVSGGKVRAYRLGAFEGKSGHLVNDLLGGVPVSVAYCNLTKCVRIYTDPSASAPLNVEVSGTLNDEMVLKFAGNLYFHKSGRSLTPGEGPPTIPCDQLTPTMTTWKEWTKQHPDTDVYVDKPPGYYGAGPATGPSPPEVASPK